MTTVNRLNTAISAVRGIPHATSEAYSRDLRRAGIFPETSRGGPKSAPRITTQMAGYMLAALLRGSPTAAAENAREVGDLIVHDSIGNPSGVNAGEERSDPILDCQLAMFGWPSDMSFAGMVGWLIDRYVDGTIDKFIDTTNGYRISVDRYWTRASLLCHPAIHLVDQYVEAWRAAFKGLEHPPLPDRKADGSLVRAMEVDFHTPLLHEAKISYGVDKARNREAHLKYREMRQRAAEFDLHGSESVTHRTIIAIAEIFK